MTTIGKRYLDRSSKKDRPRIVDSRIRSILSTVLREGRGMALEGYLIAMGRHMKRRVTILLLLLQFSFSYGQGTSLTGSIRNEAGTALPFVDVVLQGTTKGAVSDKNGRFSIADIPNGEHTLLASMLGYGLYVQQVTLPIDSDLLITLKERVVDLPAFTVQNSMTGGSGPSQEQAGSVWYIGPREMQQFVYTDVSRLLRSVPGVNVQEEDGFGLRPNIGLRGAGPERASKITIMEDGVLIAPAAYSSPAAYYFPTVGRMHAIEVAKGSSQVRYGPLTTGGAINLISTPVPERSSGMVAAWGGSYGMRNLHARAGTEVDRVGVLVETFQQAADGFKILDNAGPTGFEKSDHLGKVTWRNNPEARVQHAISLKANLTTETSNETYLGLTRDDLATDPYRRYAGSQKDRMEVRHDLLTAQYAVTLPGGPELVATFYRTNTYRNWYKLDQVVDTSGTKVGIASLLDEPGSQQYAYAVVRGASSNDNSLLVKANNRNYQTSGIQLMATHKLDGEKADHGFEVGLRLHNDHMDRFQWTDGYRMDQGTMLQTNAGQPGTESNRLASADALAAHVVYDLEYGRLGFHPGVRYEHITLREDNYGKLDPYRSGADLWSTQNIVDVVIPGIGVDFDLSTSTMVFAGVHKGFSPPGTNPETRPEASVNYEAGLRYAGRCLEMQAIGFFNDYSELLGSDLAAAGGGGTGDLFNGGKAQVSGLELFITHDLLKIRSDGLRLPISIGYTFTDARFGSSFESSFDAWGTVLDGDRIPYIASNQANLRVAMEGRKGSVSLNVNHMGRMATRTGAALDEDRDGVPSFTVIDVAAMYRWGKQAELFATVQNALDQVYLVSLVPAGARPGMPRAVQAGIRFRL